MSTKKLEGLDKAIADYNSAMALYNKSLLRICQLETEIDICRIIDWQIAKERESKYCVDYTYGTAMQTFNHNQMPVVNWLRAVERMAKSRYKHTVKIAVIERFVRKNNWTQQDKDDWLFNMNAQIAAYIGKDVELVFKKKDDGEG